MKVPVLPAIRALVAVSCIPALAKSNTPTTRTQASTAHHDTQFLEKANQGSVNEIDLAEVALQKSTNEDVKNFAQKMITDHNTLLNDMKPFDNEAGLQIPSQPDAAATALRTRLDALSGEAFDKAYIKAMVEDHHKDLEAFMAEKKATGYPAFRNAVDQGEQVVREHLQLIDQIAKKNGVASAPVPSGA
jgi:putative membrane protein